MKKQHCSRTPELERRLLSSVSVQEGLVTIHDPIMGNVVSYVLPTNLPWVISCGMVGMSIAFGTSVSGDSSSVGNEIEISLAHGVASQDVCAILAPQIGRRLKAMLREPPT